MHGRAKCDTSAPPRDNALDDDRTLEPKRAPLLHCADDGLDKLTAKAEIKQADSRKRVDQVPKFLNRRRGHRFVTPVSGSKYHECIVSDGHSRRSAERFPLDDSRGKLSCI